MRKYNYLQVLKIYIDLLDQGFSGNALYRELSKELNITIGAAKGLVHRMKQYVKSLPEGEGEVWSLLSQLQDKVKYLTREVSLYSSLSQSVISYLKTRRPVFQKVSRNYDDNVFIMLRSDSHIGRIVSKEEVDGLNEYNFEIYKERLSMLLSRTEHLLSIYPFSKVGVVFYLGDIVDGESIFPGHSFKTEFSTFDQVFEGVEREGVFLLELAKFFDKLYVFCVPGNHGRAGKKDQYRERTNFDLVFYKALDLYLKDVDDIEVNITLNNSLVVKLFDYLFIAKHRPGRSLLRTVSYYSLSKDALRHHSIVNSALYYFVNNERQILRQNVDGVYFLYGHYHEGNVLNGGNIIVNPSMMGVDDYAYNDLVVYSQPAQYILSLDNKGVSAFWKVVLEDKPRYFDINVVEGGKNE